MTLGKPGALCKYRGGPRTASWRRCCWAQPGRKGKSGQSRALGRGNGFCKGAELSPGVRSLAGGSAKEKRDPGGLAGNRNGSGALNGPAKEGAFISRGRSFHCLVAQPVTYNLGKAVCSLGASAVRPALLFPLVSSFLGFGRTWWSVFVSSGCCDETPRLGVGLRQLASSLSEVWRLEIQGQGVSRSVLSAASAWLAGVLGSFLCTCPSGVCLCVPAPCLIRTLVRLD